MDKRQELVNQLTLINAQADSIRKQIDAIDHTERLAQAKQYEGKYYQQIDKHHPENIDCLFVYGTDVEKCEPKAIVVRYWTGKEDSYFSLEFSSLFHPKRYDEEDKYIEITKEEFLKHYYAVQERIQRTSGQTP